MSITDEIIKSLTSSWLNTANANLMRLERYYQADQSMSDNGMFTRADTSDPVVQRLFKPVNLVSMIVDEPVPSLASGKLSITSPAGNDALEKWAQDFYRRRIRSRMDDLVRWAGLYGESYLYLWTDREGRSKGLKSMALPPVSGAAPRVLADYGGEDPEELTAAVMFSQNPTGISGGIIEFRTIVTANWIRIDKRERKQGQGGASLTSDSWQVVREGELAAGVIPVIPVWNPTPSDALNVIRNQDDYDKLLVNWRSAEEYAGFPSWTVDTNLPESVNVGPNQIMSGGTWGVLEAPSIQPFIDRRTVILDDASKQASSIKLARESGAAMSGVALQYLQRSFTDKLEGKAALVSSALENAFWTAARILAVDAELYAIETAGLTNPPSQADLAQAELTVTLAPNVPADLLADANRASVLLNDLGASRETALAIAGIDNPQEEIERARAEAEAEREPAPVLFGQLDVADDTEQPEEGDAE